MSTASLITTWKVRDVVPVPDQFPTSLPVLVVDDDPTCLIFLEKMLRNCSYDVTKCNQIKTALSKLRENRNGFDIITSNVYMPDMDGFKLLEHIGLDIDMPIISLAFIMASCSTCIFYSDALKNIWEHVVRKRKNEWKDLEQSGTVEEGDWQKLEKLEKSKDNKDETEDKDDTSTLKTPRFVASVNQLGIDMFIFLKLKYVGLPHEDAREHLKSFLLICTSFSEKGCNIPK
ncbi:hypothetical protein E1A91_D11G245500v1 [Gossypium mustelinum]|uniref:Response regulatory domain-containing protein n=1 Tax=Gossypium mustelinum TaxID=34275 RepID=A0A5D2SWX6_GOSMU|nr:hypothetical protein E1A91_D11G245500v1 [Gossypium mustelinum]